MSRDAVEQIKARLNIVDVVGWYVKLQKAGKNYKARSPFTNERTPSFYVSSDQGLYYCFSSGKGGDMFTFVQEMEGTDFVGALKLLADRAGVELKPEKPGVRSERDAIFAALETATRFYEAQLPKQEKVIEYLKKRGMTGKTAKAFRVGYALEGWTTLHDHLLGKGFSTDIMQKAGLITSGEGDRRYYDRFRGRIMFPIANASGKVAGFSGRVFYVSGASEDKTAKYVNSPETEVYNKSEILYGFDKAKQAIRKSNTCIFVEGQMDLVMSHQAGVENTVAVSGTALGAYHLGMVSRIADNLVFAFDADDAGVSAAKRSINLALSEGFEVKAVSIPDGKDPADCIRDDPAKWVLATEHAEHVIDFQIKRALEKSGGDQKILRKKIEENVLPYVAHLRSSIDQAQFVAKISELLHISEEAIWNELRKTAALVVEKDSNAPQTTAGSQREKTKSRKEIIEERIMGIILWQERVETPQINVDTMRERFLVLLNKGALEEPNQTEKGRLVFEAEIYCGQEGGTILKHVEDLLSNYKKELLREESAQLRSKLFDKTLSEAQEREVMERIREVQKEIDTLDSNKAEA